MLRIRSFIVVRDSNKQTKESLANSDVQFRSKRLPFVIDDIIVRLEECGSEASQEVVKWKALNKILK